LRRDLVPTRNLRDHGARRVGLRHDLSLDVVGPTTASGSRLQRVNNIRNQVAIRSLHDGTHIAGSPSYNKVGEKYRLQFTDCRSHLENRKGLIVPCADERYFGLNGFGFSVQPG
jgi:hypothetical protein